MCVCRTYNYRRAFFEDGSYFKCALQSNWYVCVFGLQSSISAKSCFERLCLMRCKGKMYLGSDELRAKSRRVTSSSLAAEPTELDGIVQYRFSPHADWRADTVVNI